MLDTLTLRSAHFLVQSLHNQNYYDVSLSGQLEGHSQSSPSKPKQKAPEFFVERDS